MTWDDHMADLADAIYGDEDFVDAGVTYRGAAVSGHVEAGEHPEKSQNANRARAVLKVPKAQVVAWAYGDVVTALGYTWRVLGQKAETAVDWHLSIDRDVRQAFRK
mgnify:CR=1 FL=1